jgi:imidazolonepropionase-like amidohydrolase
MKSRTLVCLVCLAIPARGQVAAVTLAIEHATVVPMTSDTALVDHTVLVGGDRIVWVGPAALARVPRSATRVDARARVVVPGLADMHVHLSRRDELRALVAGGVTTVRNMRGAPIHLAWRDSLQRGLLQGPRLYTAGPSLRGRAGDGFAKVGSPAEAASVVRGQAAAGYDMIKVLYGIDRATYDRIIATARERRLPVVGHLITEAGLQHSLEARQASLEHAASLFEPSLVERLMSRVRSTDLRRPVVDSLAGVIARAGVPVGTIVTGGWTQCTAPTRAARQAIDALHRAGVALIGGSDLGMGTIMGPDAIRCELRTLVASGLTPYQALATVTVNAGRFLSEYLHAEPAGVIAAGYRADLLILVDDPRRNIRAIDSPVSVIAGGKPVR